jgi:hypothetical protein
MVNWCSFFENFSVNGTSFEHRIGPHGSIALLFFFWDEALPDVPEKHPVKEQVDDEKNGKYKARVIMHGHSLIFGILRNCIHPLPLRRLPERRDTGQARKQVTG